MEVKLHRILPMPTFTLKEECQEKILAGLIKPWGQPSVPKERAIPTSLLAISAAEQGVVFRAIQGVFGVTLYSRVCKQAGVHHDDNSDRKSGVLSPKGNLQVTCEDFEDVTDLRDWRLQLRGLL